MNINQLLLMTVCLCLAFALTPVARSAESDGAASVALNYDVPVIAVPRMQNPPVIDGNIAPDEWVGASSVNALKTKRAGISNRETQYWLGWDEQNLYIAMRSWLRQGERPIQKIRGEDGDPAVVFDDSYEFYFDSGGTLAGDLPAFTQYIGNFAGMKYDTAHLPTIGIRRMSYEAGWEPRNRIVETDRGRAWEMEVAVPYKSILKSAPYQAGDQIKALLARNYKRPWEQNSVEGTQNFRDPAKYTKLNLVDSRPAIQVNRVGDRKAGTLGLSFNAFGYGSTQLAWQYQSDAGITKSGILEVADGKLVAGPDLPAIEKLTNPTAPAARYSELGSARIQIKDLKDDMVLFDWVTFRAFAGVDPEGKTFTDDQGDVAKLSLVFNPVCDYLRIKGDFINYDNREAIATFLVSVTDENEQIIAKRELSLDEVAYVRDVLELPNLKPGQYTSRLVCTDAQGKIRVDETSPFEKKDPAKAFAWWKTDKGRIDRVIQPWEPVGYDSNKQQASAWGRTMEIGHAGLPGRISAVGRELLAAPIRLQAIGHDDKPIELQDTNIKVVSKEDHKLELQATSKLGSLAITSNIEIAFDGMYKISMTLDPQAATQIKALQMVVPFNNQTAEYVTACGEGIRWGYNHHIIDPNQQGEIWNCKSVDGQRMAKGSFIPYVWVGNTYGGLCWFADTDRGWLPSDQTPAIVLRRDKDTASTDLVFNLVSEAAILDQSRTITFAFQATPVKPLPVDWRNHVYSFGDSFADWQTASSIGSSRMLSPVPWSFDVPKARKAMQAYKKRPRMLSTYSQPVIPYGRHNELISKHMPEAAYFGEQWNSKGSWHIFYDDSLIDYWIYQLDQWIQKTDIDGYYSDNTHPAVCFNVAAGRAYRLPDGRVQPGYNMFGLRRYFLRMRAVFSEHGKDGWIVSHMTHNMVMPWLGACDYALDGEDHHITGKQNRTYLDAWPLERLQADIPRALGVRVTYKTEFDTPRWWYSEGKYTFHDVWRSYAAAMQLHDNLPMSSHGMPETWFHGRSRFGMADPAMRFIGYWENDPAVHVSDDKVKVSAWSKPGSILLCVVGMQKNDNPQEVTITLDPEKLNLPHPRYWYLYNAEAIAEHAKFVDGKALNVYPGSKANFLLQDDGTILVHAPRHDYLNLILTNGNQPLIQP